MTPFEFEIDTFYALSRIKASSKGCVEMDFFKKNARQISNVLVVVAVVLAVYIKWTGDGSEAFFKEYDVYIIGGIALGFVVLSFFKKK